jgi:hypothetical protein
VLLASFAVLLACLCSRAGVQQLSWRAC